MANIPVCIDGCLTVNDEGSLIVATGVWPYDCDDTEGETAYCGSDGTLRTAPPTDFSQRSGFENQTGLTINVPDEPTVMFTLDTAELAATGGIPASAFQNPSNCRPALVFESIEFDVDIDVPAGGGYMTFIAGDRMVRISNTGNATATNQGIQTTKNVMSVLAPGATHTPNYDLSVAGFGAGTPVLNRRQYVYRIAIIAVGS
jgi:hypothetical protein